jgi:hypothetical protein
MPTSTEINPQLIAAALKQVRDQTTFLNALLAETLNWPIANGVTDVDDISYEWSEADLRARELSKKLIAGRVLQVQLTTDQPWGIFILEFASDEVFKTDRGMTGILRQVLRGLVKNRNKPGSVPSWRRENLLFICTHKYEHFRVAHFKAPKDDSRTARLAAFGWGPDIPARTACEFNLNHLGWPDDAVGFDHWTEAFNVEKVTRRFYQDYAQQDEALRTVVAEQMGEDDIEAEPVKMFTQTLLNRLMFLRFIERKGWLAPPGGTADKDYLRLLFKAGNYRGRSFYNSRLRKLFFEGLAVEGKQESESIGKVPFLNGGLFEENALDEKVSEIPNEAFAPLLGEEGLFYRFNFTVQESTPLDVEVAVDPEMLGKVFEELVTGRHESGSYYTPRPVVSFMCKEALKGYLAQATEIAAEKVAAFVDRHETPFGINDAKKIAKALDDVRAVDPACGSGAYLLGLLHEIVDLYRALYTEKLKTDDRELHRIKLDIIEKSLYGVDVDPFATNIAMLRLWLSLTVDSRTPRALPNLDFKIEAGDSLTGPDPQEYSVLHLQERALQLAILKGKYMRARAEQKQSLRRLIQKEQREIAFELRSLCPGAVDWRVQFCEIFFAERAGFDIVLANPPYIRQELIKDSKPALKKVYKEQFSGTADLYVFFYLRALQLLAKGGMLVFISSNKWFRAGYGVKLRALVAKRTNVRTILDFHDLPVFESAIAYPMIFIAANRPVVDGDIATLVEPPTLDAPYPDVTAVVRKFGQSLPRSALGSDGNWRLATASISDRVIKMQSTGPRLQQYVNNRIYRGVMTGLNSAFIVDRRTRDELVAADRKCADVLRPMAAGKDVKKWTIAQRDRWLLFVPWEEDLNAYPPIKKHLSRFRTELEARPDVREGRHPWWTLSRYGAEHIDDWNLPNIAYQEIATYQGFALGKPGQFFNNKVFFIVSDDLYLLSVLNSKACWWFLGETTAKLIAGAYALQRPFIEQIPIPDASTADRKLIGSLAQKCLNAAGVGCEAWEKEIDERVSALYGL